MDELKENKVEGNTLGASTLKQTQNSQKIMPKVVDAPAPVQQRRVRIVKQTIFFQGNAFEIEEEISIDSDEEESVFTSEDDFEVKNDKVVEEYNQRLEKRILEMDPEEKEKIDLL